MPHTVNNAHMIEVKYIGPTNTQGSRVKISSERFGDSVTIALNSAFRSSTDAAIDWLQTRGVDCLYTGEISGKRDVIAVRQFRSLAAIKAGECAK